MSQESTPAPGPERLWRTGRTAWATLGILGVAVVVLYLVSLVSLLVIPVVLALFPATLLRPVADRLRRAKVPDALASLLSILLGIGLIVGVIGAMVPVVADQIPELAESAGEGVDEIEAWLETEPFGLQVGGLSELIAAAQEQVGDIGEYAGEAADAAFAAFEVLIGLLLLFVVLFFYLKDGRRLRDGLVSTLPGRARARTRQALDQAWSTLGSYFRGQLLVALVDAVFIGIGLVILGVPLALPLAVLIFFGGLFPIVGAVSTGALAVLVALADGGLGTGLAVLALVLAVQQLESNVLEPFILGRAIRLHPLVVLLVITAGSLLLGILGAFLAVPTAAIIARILDDVRAGPPPEEFEEQVAAETPPTPAEQAEQEAAEQAAAESAASSSGSSAR
ncbi:AI-2E family transporter [Egicoccus sp. AB-alg2]|uniref:AI-2E family transporter n=1 Tax=Egicoccus sp. AB-alg2 TaxID=3242693 RepID=UPI00359E13AE